LAEHKSPRDRPATYYNLWVERLRRGRWLDSGLAKLGDALFTARPLYERALGMLSIRTWSWSR
jgi:hypothetical protein